MTGQVIYNQEAVEDLERLFDHVQVSELNNPTGNLDISARAIESLKQACQLLLCTARLVAEKREIVHSCVNSSFRSAVPATLLCLKFKILSRSSSVLFGISMKVITTENWGLPCCADAATHVLEKLSDGLNVEFFLPESCQ
jgi:hypothetical protein